MSLWEQWRPWLQRHQAVVRELIAMLLVALVVGVYFLENFSNRVEAEQRLQLQALASQTARRAAEALVSDDAISLNLITRETLALAPVAGVVLEDASGERVRGRGQQDQQEPGLTVREPVALPDGEVVGSVLLFAEPGEQRQRLESGYVLVVLCLMLLWVAGRVIAARLFPAPEPAVDSPLVQRQPRSLTSKARADEPLQAQLRISIVNFERLRNRYTRDALAKVLAEYQQQLNRVAALYGARVEQQLGEQARLTFTGDSPVQAAFSGVCCGLLFLRVARLGAPARKARGDLPLEFKALVTIEADEQESWALCVAGVPGRLQVPEPQLARCELDVKALYQPDKALVVNCDDRQVRLQPVEQLAHRYQTLLRTQADTLMSESGGDTQGGDSK